MGAEPRTVHSRWEPCLPPKLRLVRGMQQSSPTLLIARYSCSLSFTTTRIWRHCHQRCHSPWRPISLGYQTLYTFSSSDQLGSIDLHALLTHIPLSSPLITVLNPDLLSPWATPSATGAVQNDPINLHLSPFDIASTARAWRGHWF